MSPHDVVNRCKLVAVLLLWLGKWGQCPAGPANVLAKLLAPRASEWPKYRKFVQCGLQSKVNNII